jgi:hypothetical protein
MAEELTVGGRARRFSIRVPRAADGEIPLVLVLHGNHPEARGSHMREWTTFDRQADARGFAVAYPDGLGGYDHPGPAGLRSGSRRLNIVYPWLETRFYPRADVRAAGRRDDRGRKNPAAIAGGGGHDQRPDGDASVGP